MVKGSSKSRRVIIVGAKFGEIYLNAFMNNPDGIELVGLLARGSIRARELAHAFGVPLYTDIEQIPDDIDIACVVVRSAIVGGDGTALAETFLKRGINVLQEHPVHPGDIDRLQSLASVCGTAYWVNSFYPHTPGGHSWISSVNRLRTLHDGEEAHFVHLTTSRQLLYSSLDLLVLASGTHPEAWVVNCLSPDTTPFQILRLDSSDLSVILHLQSYLDPQDPDLHSLTMHRCVFGWPAGYLSLETGYGPVVWTAGFHDPIHLENDHSIRRRIRCMDAAFLDMTCSTTIHPAPRTWRDAFEVDGPSGVARVLHMMKRYLDGEVLSTAFTREHQKALAMLWQKILHSAGPACEKCLDDPISVLPADLSHKLELDEALS